MSDSPIFQLYTLSEPLDRQSLLAEFSRFPEVLAGLVRDAPVDALMARPDPEEWSAFQVVCHIRDVVMVYGARFRWMVLDDDPFLPNYDEDRWVADCRDTPDDLPRLLDHIAGSRADICALLGRIRDDEWQRTGRHEVLGRVVLEEYVRHEVEHERQHSEQIRLALAAR